MVEPEEEEEMVIEIVVGGQPNTNLSILVVVVEALPIDAGGIDALAEVAKLVPLKPPMLMKAFQKLPNF